MNRETQAFMVRCGGVIDFTACVTLPGEMDERTRDRVLYPGRTARKLVHSTNRRCHKHKSANIETGRESNGTDSILRNGTKCLYLCCMSYACLKSILIKGHQFNKGLRQRLR
jgi:hypothetical protein